MNDVVKNNETFEDFVRESLRLYPPSRPRLFATSREDAEVSPHAIQQSSQAQRNDQTSSSPCRDLECSTIVETASSLSSSRQEK
jgi:hypothetical protein